MKEILRANVDRAEISYTFVIKEGIDVREDGAEYWEVSIVMATEHLHEKVYQTQFACLVKANQIVAEAINRFITIGEVFQDKDRRDVS